MVAIFEFSKSAILTVMVVGVRFWVLVSQF